MLNAEFQQTVQADKGESNSIDHVQRDVMRWATDVAVGAWKNATGITAAEMISSAVASEAQRMYASAEKFLPSFDIEKSASPASVGEKPPYTGPLDKASIPTSSGDKSVTTESSSDVLDKSGAAGASSEVRYKAGDNPAMIGSADRLEDHIDLQHSREKRGEAVGTKSEDTAASLHKLSLSHQLNDRRDAAMNPETSKADLAHLAKDPDQYVLQGVAGNEHTSQDVLRKLASSENNVVQTALCRNPNTPIDALEKMAKHNQYAKMALEMRKHNEYLTDKSVPYWMQPDA